MFHSADTLHLMVSFIPYLYSSQKEACETLKKMRSKRSTDENQLIRSSGITSFSGRVYVNYMNEPQNT